MLKLPLVLLFCMGDSHTSAVCLPGLLFQAANYLHCSFLHECVSFQFCFASSWIKMESILYSFTSDFPLSSYRFLDIWVGGETSE